MDDKQLNELLQKYLDNSLNAQEADLLRAYLRREENQELLQKAIDEALGKNAFAGLSDKSQSDKLFQGILQKARQKERFRIKPFWRMAAAALLIMAVGTVAYLVYIDRPKKEIVKAEKVTGPPNNDILPGGDKAVLTLGSGDTIALDDAANGTLALQGNIKVLKLNSGQLAYATENKPTEVVYNKVTTPRGGQYKVQLPDGTKVWLNAASSLRFPTAFNGDERPVEVTGEAYFEVARNPAQPFRVAVNGMEVRVLGTHFNINAYTDEASINTTLVEGSVMVTKNGKQVTIKPGQQARVDEGIYIVPDVDVETLTAWKNGRFSFSNASLESLMRPIARWYDVEVVLDDKITDAYTIDVPRDVPVSKLLRFIERSGGVHFIIEGEKIICKKSK